MIELRRTAFDPAMVDILQSRSKALVELIFYGNYFYGLCAVGLILESVLRLQLMLDGPLIYVMAFLATVLFYNYPYLVDPSVRSENPRVMWFSRNHKLVLLTQIGFALGLVACAVLWGIRYLFTIAFPDLTMCLLLALFPLVAGMYYGSHPLNLRQMGQLKPFLIGFVWAGMVNVYPLLYSDLIHSQPFEFSLIRVILFVKTFLYISMLAIMFDIKDYAQDQQAQLKTWVVKIGVRQSLRYVIVPLTVFGLCVFLAYAHYSHLSALKMSLIMIPFVLLMAATKLFSKNRSLLFYLSVIDGLLLVKAFFGILAVFV